MKTQYRDPDGILNHLTKVKSDSSIFHLLMGSGECYNPIIIQKATCLNELQKEQLLKVCTSPLTLKAQVRIFLKDLINRNLPQCVPTFEIPDVLKRYLLYEYI